MSFLRFKRPSSARRNIKQETFTPFVSGSRLRHVQSLLNDGTKTTECLPDAILCIAGIDSRYNDGMLELINYLLFGFFEIRKAELESSGFEEEVIDDIVLLIKADQVDVYCNPINYHYLLPYVSHWRNVFFHCLNDDKYDDEEKAEEFKISTFVNIVQNCKRIGIPYSNSGNLQTFDPMIIEKWPIIQVYAVEGVGSGGFFTMLHEVVDVSKECHQIYNNMDPVYLEHMIIEQLTKFERQWQTMISTVEVAINSNDSQALTEDKVFDPLRSFYVHGHLGAGDGKSGPRNMPFVLFGSNTSKSSLQRIERGDYSSRSNLKTTMVGAHGANFMVCKAVSPRGPVTCSRTYFFTPQYVNPFQDAKVAGHEEKIDFRLLVNLYSAIVDATLSGIQAYSHTLSVKQAEKVAKEMFHNICTDSSDVTVASFVKNQSNIEFSLTALDNSGSYQPLKEGERSLLVKCASVILHDIPSCERSGSILGSLQFSESFLESNIQLKNKDGQVHFDTSYLLLTDYIPRHKTWAYTSLEEERRLLQDKLEDDSLTENFGKLLLSGDPVHVGCSNSLSMPPDEASLYAYENGLIVLDPHYGAIVLHGNFISSAVFYDGDTSYTVAVLLLEYKDDLVPYIPHHLHNDQSQLVLLFTPKSKAYKHLYSDVLHNWRAEEDAPKVQRIDEIPDTCTLMHTLLQHRHMTSRSQTNKVKTPLQKASINLPHLEHFINHFSTSSVGWYPIPETDLPALLDQQQDMEGVDQSNIEIVVTVISGVPGGHQVQLCDVISSLSKDQNRYVVLKPNLDSSQTFSAIDIQAKLKATLNVHRRRKQGSVMQRNTRVLYIVPGYTDIVGAVHAIQNHPDPDVRAHCIIGSVTACVDPLNTFMENKYTFPYLLNACSQGWVNQILMTSSTALKNEDLESIQHMLRSVNADVAFLLAERGQISRSMDLDAVLSESSFSSPAKVRARHLMCPGWTIGRYGQSSKLTSVPLKFNLPLDRQKLINKLRGLKKNLVPYPFTGNVYNVHGKVKFLGSKSDESMEVHHTTLTGYTHIATATETGRDRTQNSGNFLMFTGYQLDITTLKDWLRDCAPKKPEKKPLLTRKDLPRDLVKKIHKEQHLQPLPEGWFYNGTQYVSFDGSKQDTHPNLDEFLARYLSEKNSEIESFNTEADRLAAAFKDLFS